MFDKISDWLMWKIMRYVIGVLDKKYPADCKSLEISGHKFKLNQSKMGKSTLLSIYTSKMYEQYTNLLFQTQNARDKYTEEYKSMVRELVAQYTMLYHMSSEDDENIIPHPSDYESMLFSVSEHLGDIIHVLTAHKIAQNQEDKHLQAVIKDAYMHAAVAAIKELGADNNPVSINAVRYIFNDMLIDTNGVYTRSEIMSTVRTTSEQYMLGLEITCYVVAGILAAVCAIMLTHGAIALTIPTFFIGGCFMIGAEMLHKWIRQGTTYKKNKDLFNFLAQKICYKETQMVLDQINGLTQLKGEQCGSSKENINHNN